MLRGRGHLAGMSPPPPPGRPWLVRMRWRDLLFMHWPVPPAALRPHIPAELAVDTFEGDAWLGVVPFHMDIRPRCTPPVPLPGLTRFPELNVRTYVTPREGGGLPGVWFFSLDAHSAAAVAAARRLGLPYFRADMTCRRDGDAVAYSSVRTHLHRYPAPPASFAARYGPTGPVAHATPGSLDHFLTERYGMYWRSPQATLLRVDIRHPPWPLQPAQCQVEHLSMTRLLDLDLAASTPLLHFARTLDVRAWGPQAI